MADSHVLDATRRVGEYGDMALWHGVVSSVVPWIVRPPAKSASDDDVMSDKKQVQVYYTLRGPPIDFDMCAKCYHAKFGPLGVASHFVQQQLPPAGRSCDMCQFGSAPGPETTLGIGHFRAVAIDNRVVEAAQMGVWSHFDTFIAVLTTLPVCKERLGATDGIWYGFPELPVCGACWASFGSRTALAPRNVFQAQFIPAETVCALYSPRMRARVLEWGDASASNADAELVQLLECAAERSETWQRCCKPWMEYRLGKCNVEIEPGSMEAALREWEAVE